MRFGRWLPALSAFAATAAALLVMSGAGAAANGPDLSSPQSIDAYLLSIGVDPAAAVRQDGRMNWAGPDCPGKPWSCATGNVIVQVVDDGPGTLNRATCAPPIIIDVDEVPGCVIIQEGQNNNAQCTQRDGPVQACTIVQTGDRNMAMITQSIDQNGGATQEALQTAVLTQTSSGSGNQGIVSQTVSQSTSDGTAQKQDAHQSVVGDQTATGGAGNSLQADQDQSQKAFGGAEQDQNATPSNATDCQALFPTQPNACANITQTSNTGNNHSHLRQSIHQDANTALVADQQQGTSGGGVEGRVHQETTSGNQLNDANQDKRQHMSGAEGSFQVQWDPVYCCGVGSQVGGTGMESIGQASTQDATEANAFQESILIGQSLTPNGTCSIKQHASNNADSATNSESLTPCPFLLLATSCTNGESEGSGDIGIQQELPEGCVASPPDTGDEVCLVCVEGPLLVIRPRG